MEKSLDLIPSLKVAMMRFKNTASLEDLETLYDIMNDMQRDIWEHWMDTRGVRAS